MYTNLLIPVLQTVNRTVFFIQYIIIDSTNDRKFLAKNLHPVHIALFANGIYKRLYVFKQLFKSTIRFRNVNNSTLSTDSHARKEN